MQTTRNSQAVFVWTYFKLISMVGIIFLQFGCAYKFGYDQRDLPGGFKQVDIPVFKNKTQIVGVEAFFTNDLIHQFNRSKVAKVVSGPSAPAVIEGQINSITFTPSSQVDGDESKFSKYKLPKKTVLTIEYRVIVVVELALRRNSDQKIIWSSQFSNEKVYTAPQLGLAVVNSADALYNHSARMEVLERIAKELMNEAHDRMTENF